MLEAIDNQIAEHRLERNRMHQRLRIIFDPHVFSNMAGVPDVTGPGTATLRFPPKHSLIGHL